MFGAKNKARIKELERSNKSLLEELEQSSNRIKSLTAEIRYLENKISRALEFGLKPAAETRILSKVQREDINELIRGLNISLNTERQNAA